MRGTVWLETRLKEGPQKVGQVWIDGTSLRHAEDRAAAPESLTLLPDLSALRERIKTDDAGEFRPVRGAPNLRRGWRTPSLPVPELAAWLNVIYPSVLAFAELAAYGILDVTPFSETRARQTGMYRLTQLATDEQVARTIAAVCDPGCLRQRLWSDGPPHTEGIPLLCPEACNYFVSKCRETMVADRKAVEAS